MPWSFPLPPLQPLRRDVAPSDHAERQRLRDQFAAAALSGILTEDDANAMEWRREQVCREAYNWAEVMLDERRRRVVSPEAK